MFLELREKWRVSFLYFNAVDLNTNNGGAVKEAADRAIALAPEAGES